MARSFAQSFYKSKPWRAAREYVLRRDMYTCRDCGGRATEVHHIIELTPDNIVDPSVALNPDNLSCLCHDCHTKRTMGGGDLPDEYEFDERGHVVRARG